jgi:RNA binding exosome subunit
VPDESTYQRILEIARIHCPEIVRHIEKERQNVWWKALEPMTREDIEEWLDQLSRKVERAHKYYLQTRDDKKIVDDLYELVRELEKLRSKLLH